jgi:hypothetical protein
MVDKERFPVSFPQVAKMVGEGWTPLLEDLMVKLFRLGWGGGLDQVKEKYGGLRFYFINDCKGEVAQLIAEDLVHYAENKSCEICDTCGKWGKLRGKGWIYAACKEHSKPEDLKDWEKEKEPEDENL